MRRLTSLFLLAFVCSMAGCTDNTCNDSICGDHNRDNRVDRSGSASPSKSAAERIKDLDLGLDVDLFERTLGRENRISTYAGDSEDFFYTGEGGKVRELTARIYKVGSFYVQVGANKTGTVIVMIIQSCDSKVRLAVPRQGETAVLNSTRFSEMSKDPPKRASYTVPVSNPGEFIEFSSPGGVDDGVGEVWGVGPACNSKWAGNGEEPMINWNGTGGRLRVPAVTYYPDIPNPTVSPWRELSRFREGKTINLYGKASPVFDPDQFPLLPGHGTPEEIVSRLEKASSKSSPPGVGA
ncbi:hypothetical protein [Streptomyces sp. NPDC048256]|uniref:hypothetical protein n=1 Tax=Streptomyces sp. NPDC048256 TaxID=3154613 RepID=UPI0034011152